MWFHEWQNQTHAPSFLTTCAVARLPTHPKHQVEDEESQFDKFVTRSHTAAFHDEKRDGGTQAARCRNANDLPTGGCDRWRLSPTLAAPRIPRRAAAAAAATFARGLFRSPRNVKHGPDFPLTLWLGDCVPARCVQTRCVFSTKL